LGIPDPPLFIGVLIAVWIDHNVFTRNLADSRRVPFSRAKGLSVDFSHLANRYQVDQVS
jgi:hypothetical protein